MIKLIKINETYIKKFGIFNEDNTFVIVKDPLKALVHLDLKQVYGVRFGLLEKTLPILKAILRTTQDIKPDILNLGAVWFIKTDLYPILLMHPDYREIGVFIAPLEGDRIG